MNQPVITQFYRWETEKSTVIQVITNVGMEFHFSVRNADDPVDPTKPQMLGHVWHYNAYDPHTRTLSVHTDGPTFTCVCDIVRVTKTIQHDITHEFLKEK